MFNVNTDNCSVDCNVDPQSYMKRVDWSKPFVVEVVVADFYKHNLRVSSHYTVSPGVLCAKITVLILNKFHPTLKCTEQICMISLIPL
jgi:RES domain-containing protein